MGMQSPAAVIWEEEAAVATSCMQWSVTHKHSYLDQTKALPLPLTLCWWKALIGFRFEALVSSKGCAHDNNRLALWTPSTFYIFTQDFLSSLAQELSNIFGCVQVPLEVR